MNPSQATTLVLRLMDAFPTTRYRDQNATARLYMERLESWDYDSARAAVSRLADSCRFLPTIAELRDAYTAEGGVLPDPGRNMSPPVGPMPDPPGPEEQKEIAVIRAEIRKRISRWQEQSRVRVSPDDDGGERG